MINRIIIIFLFLLSNSMAEEISGIPKVVDGDTININNYKIIIKEIGDYFSLGILASV